MEGRTTVTCVHIACGLVATSGNRRISASELQNVLTWINKDITVAEIGQILREVDTNNDGAWACLARSPAGKRSDWFRRCYSV